MFGFLNIHKAPGPTSHDIVARVRRLVGRRIKVGHAGTLDPFAEGVLVVCVGSATRLALRVQDAPKRYLAEITLAMTSTTEDSEGQLTPTPHAIAPDNADVQKTLASFVGTFQQIPPAHSAVHVNGRRAYTLARAGEAVNLPARTVTCYDVAMVSYTYPTLMIDVRCGSGTYIRSLARDIGEALGCGGYCSHLTRTEVGAFPLDTAVRLEALAPQHDLLSPLIALEPTEKVVVDAQGVARLKRGRSVALPDQPACDEVAAVTETGQLIALATVSEDTLRPTKVFVTS